MPSRDSDPDPYSRLIPRERVHVGDAESEGEECDGDDTPRNMSMSSTGGVFCRKRGGGGERQRETERERERERERGKHCLMFLSLE